MSEEYIELRLGKVIISQDLIAEIVQIVLGDYVGKVGHKAQMKMMNLVESNFGRVKHIEVFVEGPNLPISNGESLIPVIYEFKDRGFQTPTDDFRRTKKIRKAIERTIDNYNDKNDKKEIDKEYIKAKKKKGRIKIKPKKKTISIESTHGSSTPSASKSVLELRTMDGYDGVFF